MAEAKNAKIVKTLKRLIKDSGKSHNQIAVLAGMTPQRFSNLMNNRGIIHPDELESLARALNTSIDDLFKE